MARAHKHEIKRTGAGTWRRTMFGCSGKNRGSRPSLSSICSCYSLEPFAPHRPTSPALQRTASREWLSRDQLRLVTENEGQGRQRERKVKLRLQSQLRKQKKHGQVLNASKRACACDKPRRSTRIARMRELSVARAHRRDGCSPRGPRPQRLQLPCCRVSVTGTVTRETLRWRPSAGTARCGGEEQGFWKFRWCPSTDAKKGASCHDTPQWGCNDVSECCCPTIRVCINVKGRCRLHGGRDATLNVRVDAAGCSTTRPGVGDDKLSEL